MNKGAKIVIIVIAIFLVIAVVGGLLIFNLLKNTLNMKEYKVGDDIIKSITTVVGDRTASGISTSYRDGVTNVEVVYNKQSQVQQDLLEYVTYLREEEDFKLTQDMDLTNPTGVVVMAKPAMEEGKIIMFTIHYTLSEYTFTIQKGEGTFTLY